MILGRVLGIVTVKVVVDVPAPVRRWVGTVVLLAGAVVVVAVVTGRVLVDVTGCGRLVVVVVVTGRVLVDVMGRGRLVMVVVVTGRVLVDVTGRVWVAVVTGCVVAGEVPAPARGGRLKRFTASSPLTG